MEKEKRWQALVGIKLDPESLTEKVKLLSDKEKTELWEIACCCKVDRVQALVKIGFESTIMDKMENTGLHLATKYYTPETLEYLIKLKLDVNQKNINDQTPLDMLFLENEDSKKCISFTEILIENGCKVTSNQMKILCNHLLKEPNRPFAKLLFVHFPNLFMLEAAAVGLMDDLQWLLQRGDYPEAFNINQKNEEELTILDILIQNQGQDALPITFYLIQNGAIVDNDRTKKELWKLSNQLDQIKILLDKKMFYSIGHFQTTPLHMATVNKSYEVFEYVLKNASLPVNHQDENGQTVLALLCSCPLIVDDQDSALKKMELLLTNGAQVNILDKASQSPLLHLCKNFWTQENKEVPAIFLTKLLSKGAEVKSALIFYKEVEHVEQKTTNIMDGGSYDYKTKHQIGNVEYTQHFKGSTPRVQHTWNYWSTKHYKKELAPNTYKTLKKSKKQ